MLKSPRKKGKIMEVLFTGKTELLSRGFFSAFAEEYHNVVYSESDVSHLNDCNVSAFKGETEQGLEQVFTTYNFEKVVYFSQALDGAVSVFDELEKLEKALFSCKSHKINHFIYLTTNDWNEDGNQQKESSRQILLNACFRLCTMFSDEYNTNFSILKLPYIYSIYPANNRVSKWLKEAVNEGQVSFRAMAEQETDLVCDIELGELVRRILDEPASGKLHILEVAGENKVTFYDIAECLKSNIPGLEVNYMNNTSCIPVYRKNKIPRSEYGWSSKHVFLDDLQDIIQQTMRDYKEKKKTYARKKSFEKIGGKLRVAFEILFLFVIVEALNYWVHDNVLLNFMDFRLVFVVIIGTINGLTAGLIAAFLASVGFIYANLDLTNWQVLFYNVQNWLPFAVYLLLGAACGYTKDRHVDEAMYAQEEHEILEQKYGFLNDLYLKVLENKEIYNSQVIGYRDSFGKLYSIVKRLNQVLPEQIFLEAIDVLEEALDSHSVAIYTINKNSDFARLNVCSKSLGDDFGRSLHLTKYPMMLEQLKKDQVFINLDGLAEHPAYASPVYQNGELVGMILIKYAKNRQMNMEFGNKFNIITDLIRDSLVRAMEYEERQQRFIEGTVILEAEAFESILKVKRQMKDRQYLDFTLLKIEKNGRSLEELSATISSVVRNTDSIGLGEDGSVYLLLSQTREADMGVISGRLEKNNLSYEIVRE